MIQLKNVCPSPLKEQGLNPQSDIFKVVDCTLQQGKNYCISAPSGKGKSTFLHLIYGLRKDYEGEIYIQNRNINTFGTEDWATLRQSTMAIVFQDLRLFPHLTAVENIVLKNDLQKTASESDIKAMARHLGVADFLNQSAKTLSYGQRQRIAIIRALCQPFEYLLLDEPFSHLDTPNIAAASELIKDSLQKNKAGMFMVSLGDKYFFEYDSFLNL